MATLTAQLWDEANTTKIADLEESFDRRWQDPVSDTGNGTLSVLRSSSVAGDLIIGRHVRFLLGDPTFTYRIRRRQINTVAPGEDADEVVTVSGPGIGSAWGTAVVYPAGGIAQRPQSEVRPFTWATTHVATTGWGNAYVQFPDACIPNVYDLVKGWPPLGWPAPVQSSSVQWIWSRPLALHPAGYSLFRKSFTLAANRQCVLFLSAGGRARAYVDGVEVVPWTSSYPNWSSGYTTDRVFQISAGTHELAIEAENFDYSGTQFVTPGSVGCVVAALHEVPTSGSFSASTLVVGTNNTWKVQDYPSTYPAPTPGAILQTLLSEAQARGALTGWSFGGSFSATLDSAGAAWAITQEVSPRLGDSLLAVLRQMVDLQLIDWRADATGRVLQVWNYATTLGTSPVTIAAGSNALEITHVEEAV